MSLRAILRTAGLTKVAHSEGHTLAEGYFHLYNGGVTVRVYDAGFGPRFSISNSSFGVMGASLDFAVSPEALQILGDICYIASEARGTSLPDRPLEVPSEADLSSFYAGKRKPLKEAFRKALERVSAFGHP